MHFRTSHLIPRPPVQKRMPAAPRPPMRKNPNPLYGKPNQYKRMTFDGLGAVDWASIVGVAAQTYTGQPNALSQPKPAPAAPTPIIVQGPASAPPPLIPVSKPWYQNPWVITGAVGAVLGLGYVLVSGRARSRK